MSFICAGMQVIVLGLLIRSLVSWFKRHELDASRVSERFFESPHSLQKVCWHPAKIPVHLQPMAL
jgi:hypothetical protein